MNYDTVYIFKIIYIKNQGKVNYQSSNGNFIHKDDINQITANFANFMGPVPIPKKGSESPGFL